MKIKKLSNGLVEARKRKYVGHRCLALAWDGPWSSLEKVSKDERESAACDSISDILTAVIGVSGAYDGVMVSHDGNAISKASELLDRALRSWEDDAEDYEVEV